MKKINKTQGGERFTKSFGLTPPFKRYVLEYSRTVETVVAESIEQVCFVVFENVERLGDPLRIGFPDGFRYTWGGKGTFLAHYYASKGRISLEEFLDELEPLPQQNPAPTTGCGLYHLVFDFPVQNIIEAVNCGLEIANTTSVIPDRIKLPSGESVSWDSNSAVRLIKGLIGPLKFVVENLEEDDHE